jgi:hypothetical protein
MDYGHLFGTMAMEWPSYDRMLDENEWTISLFGSDCAGMEDGSRITENAKEGGLDGIGYNYDELTSFMNTSWMVVQC